MIGHTFQRTKGVEAGTDRGSREEGGRAQKGKNNDGGKRKSSRLGWERSPLDLFFFSSALPNMIR